MEPLKSHFNCSEYLFIQEHIKAFPHVDILPNFCPFLSGTRMLPQFLKYNIIQYNDCQC